MAGDDQVYELQMLPIKDSWKSFKRLDHTWEKQIQLVVNSILEYRPEMLHIYPFKEEDDDRYKMRLSQYL